MPVTVKLRNLRIAPRKVRLVADLIRGKSVKEAQNVLNFTTKKAAGIAMKLLKSAIASAKHNFQLEESNLYISKIAVDEGQKYKRWMARARGQAYEIQKKTSHITLVLSEIVKKPPKESLRLPTGQAKKVKKVKEAKGVEKPQPAPQAPLSEEAEKVPEISKAEKPKPKLEKEKPKPKIERGIIRRIFQRRGY